MDSIWTNGSWQVVTTSNDFLFHYFILSISLSFVLSYSSNDTDQFTSLSSIIDKVQRKGGPLIKNRWKTTMLADGGPPLFFSLMKPASYYYYELKQKNKKKKEFRRLVEKKKRREWHYDWRSILIEFDSQLKFDIVVEPELIDAFATFTICTM